MPRSLLHRRDFLSAATVAGMAAVNPSFARAGQNTKDLRVAVIGVKGRGRSHIEGMAKNVVALCDVDQKVLAERAGEFEKTYGRKVQTFTDYRELVDRSDIDAVSIATPNHTHVVISIAAIEAGNDVYVEKPISHNVWEGRQLMAAARKHSRIVQCGTQSRSSRCLHEAAAWLQSGGLGEIKHAVGTCYKPRKSIGKLDAPLTIPSHVDYDLWCGPADMVDLYRPQLHYDWHWDYNTGAGDMGNQGIHQMDIARWMLGEKTLPPRTLSIGARLGYDDAGDTANTQVVLLDYEKAPILFETRGLPRSKEAQSNWGRSMDRYRGSGIGVVVQCEGGFVVIPSYSDYLAYDNQGKLIKEGHGGGNHFANFLSAVAARDASRLNADIAEGHLSSAMCHAGNVSHMLGEKAKAGDIASEIKANELLSNAFDRMASHLRANDVEIDSRPTLVMGERVEVDPQTETTTDKAASASLWKREGRAAHRVRSYEAV